MSRILLISKKLKWITRTDKYKELMNSLQGWGELCERERQLGRAGICGFLAKHAIAMNQFGKHVASQIHSDIKTVVQFVIVDEDPAVKNSAILKVFKRLRARKEEKEIHLFVPCQKTVTIRLYRVLIIRILKNGGSTIYCRLSIALLRMGNLSQQIKESFMRGAGT